MKLHSVHGKAAMSKPHDQSIMGLGSDFEVIRQCGALDHEGMIARCFESSIDAAEDAIAVMSNFGELPVHRYRGAHHCAPECLSDSLMPQAHSEDRYTGCRLGDQGETDAGLIGRAGT